MDSIYIILLIAYSVIGIVFGLGFALEAILGN